jgi:hypothetical protein
MIYKNFSVILVMNLGEYVKNCTKFGFRDSNNPRMEIEALTSKNGLTNDTVKLFEELRKKYLNLDVIRLDKNYNTRVSRHIRHLKLLGGL